MARMFFVEGVCQKDIFRITCRLSEKEKCLQTKENEDIFSVCFLLIPLVAPYDQFLI